MPKPFGAEQGGLGTGKILCLNPLGLSKVAEAQERSCAKILWG